VFAARPGRPSLTSDSGGSELDMATSGRKFIADVADSIGEQVLIRGWAKFVRKTKSTTFIVLQDTSGTVQCVGPAQLPVHV
jgi:RecJ-like exonuclease